MLINIDLMPTRLDGFKSRRIQRHERLFDNKAEADAAVKKIHELGLDAVVIRL